MIYIGDQQIKNIYIGTDEVQQNLIGTDVYYEVGGTVEIPKIAIYAISGMTVNDGDGYKEFVGRSVTAGNTGFLIMIPSGYTSFTFSYKVLNNVNNATYVVSRNSSGGNYPSIPNRDTYASYTYNVLDTTKPTFLQVIFQVSSNNSYTTTPYMRVTWDSNTMEVKQPKLPTVTATSKPISGTEGDGYAKISHNIPRSTTKENTYTVSYTPTGPCAMAAMYSSDKGNTTKYTFSFNGYDFAGQDILVYGSNYGLTVTAKMGYSNTTTTQISSTANRQYEFYIMD